MKNIVILGAGFGGLRTALKLAKKLKRKRQYKIILVDRNSYQTYTPSLYEVATAYRGSKATELDFVEELAGSACFNLQTILRRYKNIEFLKGEVEDIDLDTKAIILKSGDAINYEYCTVALGAQTAFYKVEGADLCCHTLKTLPQALSIRNKVEGAFDVVAENRDINLLIIGAGLSGFEVATEMARHAQHLCSAHDNFNKAKVKIKLFEAGDKILKGVPARMRSLAYKRLRDLNIEVLTNMRVKSIGEDEINLEDGTKAAADVSVWAGGVEGLDLFKKIKGLELRERAGTILVDNTLQIQGRKDIFAIGDSLYFFDKNMDIVVPSTAWAAEQQADVVVENIERAMNGDSLMNYEVHFPGFVSAAGGKHAIASLYGVTFAGYKAWVLKRLIDLKYILSIYPFFSGFGIWLRELDLWTRND